uniref:Uncharacterized protein n=1 Tax=Anguilla anguilla TaxID=7936 RepID=A0A0E9W164_ANGAN
MLFFSQTNKWTKNDSVIQCSI